MSYKHPDVSSLNTDFLLHKWMIKRIWVLYKPNSTSMKRQLSSSTLPSKDTSSTITKTEQTSKLIMLISGSAQMNYLQAISQKSSIQSASNKRNWSLWPKFLLFKCLETWKVQTLIWKWLHSDKLSLSTVRHVRINLKSKINRSHTWTEGFSGNRSVPLGFSRIRLGLSSMQTIMEKMY